MNKRMYPTLSAPFVMFLGLILMPFNLLAAVEVLNEVTTAWDGGDISYPDGKAKVTSVKLTLQAGQSSPYHCHPMPTLGYIAKGAGQVETKSGEILKIKEGDAVVEVMKTLHRGTAFDEDVEIIVFYAGAEGVPTTLLETSPDFKKYCL